MQPMKTIKDPDTIDNNLIISYTGFVLVKYHIYPGDVVMTEL